MRKLTQWVAFAIAIVMVITFLNFPSAAAGRPQMGTQENAADAMAVVTNGGNADDFQETKVIRVEPELRGYYGNLHFGETDSYNYSANVKFEEDLSTYGSIRMVLGYGMNESNQKQFIEVCLRPNVAGQNVLFLNGPEIGEVALATYQVGDYKELREYRYTARYENKKVSFWVDGQMIFKGEDIPLNDIVLQPGFYSQNCKGTISDIQIWGDVKGTVCPQFDEQNDTDLIPSAKGVDIITHETYKLQDAKASSAGTETKRIDLQGVALKQNYTFYAKASFEDNKNETADQTEYNWEGAIFRVARGEKDGKTYTLELRVRSGAIVFFAVDEEGWEEYLWQAQVNTSFGKDSDYVVNYFDGGTIDFWKDGASLLYQMDLNQFGYKNLQPYVGIGGEVCAFSFSDMKLVCKEATIIVDEDTEPKIGDAQNAADMIAVVTNQTEIIDYKEAKCINVEPEMRGYYGNLEFGKGDRYVYSAKVKFTEDTSTYGSIRLVLGYGFNKNNQKQFIEVCLRPTLGGQNVLFLNGPEAGEEVVATYMTGDYKALREYRYTVQYEKKKVSFWLEGQLVFEKEAINLDDIVLQPGFYSQNCKGSISNIQIWGDVKGIECPKYNAKNDVDLISDVNVVDVFSNKIYKLSEGKLASKQNATGRVDFKGVELKGDYTFYANASFFDNKNMVDKKKEYDWEGLIFRVAKGEKNGNEYTIELRVRSGAIVFFAVDTGGAETYLWQAQANTTFGKEYAYIVDYHKDGSLNFWKNKTSLLYEMDLTQFGYKNLRPFMGIGCEVCNFTFNDMKLVCEKAVMAAQVPKKPKGNGNYATTMQMMTDTIVKYENNVVYSTTDEQFTRTVFEYLPFEADESYVLKFTINTQKAKESWMGPRIIFGTDEKDQDLALFVTGDALMIAQNGEILHVAALPRELNKEYDIAMFVQPNALSVWANDILLIEEFETPNKNSAKTGLWFEYAVAHMSNMDFYYTDSVKYVAPKVPEKPVLKTIGKNQYNAADWMKVSLGGQPYSGYFQNKFIVGDSSNGYNYEFENMPITDDMTYYYSATYKVNESSDSWKAPRFIFRYHEKTPVYVAITHTAIQLIIGQEVCASAPFNMELWREYDIVIQSTPTTVSVWIDGESIFTGFDLTPYMKKILSAKLGLWFEMCQAEVTNIAIYGDEIVFNPDYVDEELYNDKYYNMDGVPAMAKGSVNLFQNISMLDNSLGSLGAVFDSEKNVLTTEYKEGTGELVFSDANGSGNLNGLKNESGYVFSFTHKVSDWKAKDRGQSGAWMIVNRSSVPSTSQVNQIGVGVSGDAIMLKVYQEGQIIVDQITPFDRVNGKEYKFDIVHGKNWIKVYADNVLKLVATELPTYNIEFNAEIYNAKAVFKDFLLYEFEDSGLKVLEDKEGREVVTAGKTIYDAKEYTPATRQAIPYGILIGLAAVVVGSIAGIIALICYLLKMGKKKPETQEVDVKIGGENI